MMLWRVIGFTLSVVLGLVGCGGGGGGGGGNKDNSAPVFISSELSIRENNFIVGNVDASDLDGDLLRYSISGGDDASFFAITPDGELSFLAAPDFEAPLDTDQDNIYRIVVSVTDGVNTVAQAIQVRVEDVNEAPVISSASEVSFLENTTGIVHQVVAVDPEGQPVTYQINSVREPNTTAFDGFEIDPVSGEITLDSPLDFEALDDLTEGTIYVMQVEVSDGVVAAQQLVYLDLQDIVGRVTAGVRLDGTAVLEAATYQMSNGGDVDGDNIDELLVTTLNDDVYLLFGDVLAEQIEAPDGVAVPLATPSPSERITLLYSACESCPANVAAGDVDGDGLSDIVVAYPNVANAEEDGGVGRVFILMGSAIKAARSQGNTHIDLATQNAANITLYAGLGRQGVGDAISVDDINNDGFADIVVSSKINPNGPSGPFIGYVFVVMGKTVSSLGASPISLDDMPASALATIKRVPSDDFGASVAIVADLDNDGLAEIAVGAPNKSQTYLLSGSKIIAAMGSVVDVANAPEVGIGVFSGAPPVYQSSGMALVSLADIDGDNLSELMIGGQSYEPEYPAAYVIPSHILVTAMSSAEHVDLSELGAGDITRIFSGFSEHNQLGRILAATTGNIDGDGIADLLVGSSNNDLLGRRGSGGAFVLYGQQLRSNAPESIDLAALTSAQGFALAGIDQFDGCGRSLAVLGDVDNDGLSEIAVGSAGEAGSVDRSGEGYILSGAMLNALPRVDDKVIDLQPLFGKE